MGDFKNKKIGEIIMSNHEEPNPLAGFDKSQSDVNNFAKKNALQLLQWIREHLNDWNLVIDCDGEGVNPADFVRIINDLAENELYDVIIMLISRHSSSWQAHFHMLDQIMQELLVDELSPQDLNDIIRHMIQKMAKEAEEYDDRF